MSANRGVQDKLKAGIEAARRGDKADAQRWLRQVLETDSNNEVAWLWLASVVDSLQERRYCLERVLKINPKNARALEALRQLGIQPSTKTAREAVKQGRPSGSSRNINPGFIAIGAVAVIVVIAALIINANVPKESQTSASDQATFQALLVTASSTPTVNPRLATATPFIGAVVDAPTARVMTLPPTFTNTPTPTATSTPLPSITPFPVSSFVLLYRAQTGDGPALYRSSGDGSGGQPVSGGTGVLDAVYSPDGQNILFVRETTYKGEGDADVTAPELFVAPVDNLDNARQITRLGGAKLEHPSWNPTNGIEIVFVSDSNGGDEDLWYITEDGNNLHRMTENPGVDKDPAWSPNGDVIVYTSDQASTPNSGLTEIFSITVDGAAITQLTDDAGSSYTPAWSPDGELITFSTDRNGDGDIYVMDRDGQRPFLLTVDDQGAEDRNPVFTPDSRKVVFLSNRQDDTFRLYMVDLQGKAVEPLADTGQDVQSLSFRPEPLYALP